VVFIHLKIGCAGTFPHEHCWRRQLKPTSRSRSCAIRWRQAPQEQRLWGITHIWCIDIDWVLVQWRSGRRWTQTGNLVVRRHLARRVSSNSRARLQMWELGKREERMEDGWMSQGGLWRGLYNVIQEVAPPPHALSPREGKPRPLTPRALALAWMPTPRAALGGLGLWLGQPLMGCHNGGPLGVFPFYFLFNY
jgi:hypothetical protein